MAGAQPCWKLAYTGSVGSQALTGIPVVRALRDDAAMGRPGPHLAVRDRAFARPMRRRIVFAEVWPSWWPIPSATRAAEGQGAGPHRRRAFSPSADRTGELARWLGRSARPRRRAGPHDRDRGGVDARGDGAAPSRPAALVLRRHYIEPPLPQWGEGRGEGSRSRESADPRKNCGRDASGPVNGPGYDYLRDPAAIYRRSFALVREEADLARFPARCGRWRCASRMPPAMSRFSTTSSGRAARSQRAASAGRRRADPRRQRDGCGRHHATRLPAGNGDLHLARSRCRGPGLGIAHDALAPPPSSCGARISPARSSRSATRRPRCSICSKSSPPAPTRRPRARVSGRVCRRRRGEGGADRVRPRA